MAQNFTKSNEAMNASAEGMLIIKQFLDDNYIFQEKGNPQTGIKLYPWILPDVRTMVGLW